MYEELVKTLRETREIVRQHPEVAMSVPPYQLSAAADAIEKLSKALDAVNDAHNDEGYDVGYWAGRRDYEPKWIPVTERLPESVCKPYLCLTDTGYHCEVRWTNNVYGFGKSDDKWGWSFVDVPQYCKVTHWMPLPEPPKED